MHATQIPKDNSADKDAVNWLEQRALKALMR